MARRCLRYRGLLYQIAERILRGPECAEEAVNRTLTLARRVPHNKPVGEFRSWVLRIVIEEALCIRRNGMGKARLAVSGPWDRASRRFS